MEPIELIGAGGASSVLLGIIVYLLRQLDKRQAPDDSAAVECARQIESLSRAISQQQEMHGQTLEAMRDLMREVREVVSSIQTTLSQRIAIEEDRWRRDQK